MTIPGPSQLMATLWYFDVARTTTWCPPMNFLVAETWRFHTLLLSWESSIYLFVISWHTLHLNKFERWSSSKRNPPNFELHSFDLFSLHEQKSARTKFFPWIISDLNIDTVLRANNVIGNTSSQSRPEPR